MMPEMLTYRSYAKINLGLEIKETRPDGYHNILTIFQTVRLHDTIIVSHSENTEIVCDDPSIPQGEGNIVFKAAEALKKKCRSNAGARIEIKKKIPSGGGMGGGSSNAAVSLIALNEMWKTKLASVDLAKLGCSIGADVPFFLTGGTALGEEKGDVINPLDDLEVMDVLLAVPDFRVSTAEAYGRTDILLTTKSRTNKIIPFLKREKEISSLTNDFELFLFPEFPILEDIANNLNGLGAIKTGVTGSGSVVFGLFPAGAGLEKFVPRLIAKFPAVNFLSTATLGRVEYQQTLRIM